MNRPLVALGLVAVALSLLTVLVADMQQAVENPRLDLSEEGADAAAKAAEKLAPKAGDAALGSEADSITLPDGATVTLPEGTEIDGDLIKLAEALAWTLPAGTELDNLSLELPPDVGFEVPDGTWVDGETLVFPPGSELRLDDGTVLQLPEGGRLTMPGASSSEMARMLDSGHGVTRAGSTFSAPTVVSDGEWPVTFPAGTEFQVPEGMRLPEGTLSSDMDVQFPPGSELQTSSADAATGTETGLFERIGQLDFSGKEPAGSGSDADARGGLAGLPALPGGAWWWWALVGAVLAVAAFLLWRYRDRLRRAWKGGMTGEANDQPPARIRYTLDERPAGLPLALDAGQSATIHLAVQAERPDAAHHSSEPDAARAVAAWMPTAAEVRLELDGESWTNRIVDVTGVRIQVPTLAPGTHRVSATVTSRDLRGPVTLTEEIHVAPWNEQVARDYQRLYDHSVAVLELPDGVTPRVLASALRARTDPDDDAALDALIHTFEVANYGHEEVDEAGWVRFASTVDRLIAALDGVAATRPMSVRAAGTDAPVVGPAATSRSGALL